MSKIKNLEKKIEELEKKIDPPKTFFEKIKDSKTAVLASTIGLIFSASVYSNLRTGIGFGASVQQSVGQMENVLHRAANKYVPNQALDKKVVMFIEQSLDFSNKYSVYNRLNKAEGGGVLLESQEAQLAKMNREIAQMFHSYEQIKKVWDDPNESEMIEEKLDSSLAHLTDIQKDSYKTAFFNVMTSDSIKSGQDLVKYFSENVILESKPKPKETQYADSFGMRT